MSEHLDRHLEEEPLDSEINVRAIAGFAVGLVAITAVSAALMWFVSGFLRDWEVSKDPPPPALPAAAEPYLPPAPRLQTEPIREIEELRAMDDRTLGSYGWEGGAARIPIDRAIELIGSGTLSPSASAGRALVDETPLDGGIE